MRGDPHRPLKEIYIDGQLETVDTFYAMDPRIMRKYSLSASMSARAPSTDPTSSSTRTYVCTAEPTPATAVPNSNKLVDQQSAEFQQGKA